MYFTNINERKNYNEQILEKHAPFLNELNKATGNSLSPNFRQNMALFIEAQTADFERKGYNLNEDNTTGSFPTSVFPNRQLLALVTMTFPALTLMEIADFQPLNVPAGLVFYEKFTASTGEPLTHNESVVSTSSIFSSSVEEANPQDVEIRWESMPVATRSWKLKTTMTAELAEDARAYAGLDLDTRVLSSMRDQIMAEIDQRGIQTIYSSLLPSSNINWSSTPGAGLYNSTRDQWNTIRDAIIDAQDIVNTRVNQYPDYMVAGRQAANYLRKTSEFIPNLEYGKAFSTGNASTAQMGTYQGMKVFFSPQVLPTKILLGQTGKGIIYAPYVPLEVTDPIRNITDPFKTTRAMRTRDAMVISDARFFATVTVS